MSENGFFTVPTHLVSSFSPVGFDAVDLGIPQFSQLASQTAAPEPDDEELSAALDFADSF